MSPKQILRTFLISQVIVAIVFGQDFDPLICSDKENGTLVQSPTMCNQFFVCIDGMIGPDLGTCPGDFYFNPDTGSCDFPDNVNCGNRPVPPPEEPTAEPTTVTTEAPAPPASKCPQEDPPEPVFLAVEHDCSSYILCFHGNEIVLKCPADHHWSRDTNECEVASRVECKEKDLFDCPPEGIEFLPHPEDCRRFIYCRDGFSRVQACGPFHSFDVEKKTCVLNVACWQVIR